MKSKLTDTECRTAKPEATPYKKSDGGGLRLLVQPNGSKLWRMAYRFGGRHKELAFGRYPTISLSDAREARDNARKLLAKGTDPAARQGGSQTRASRRQDLRGVGGRMACERGQGAQCRRQAPG